MAKEKRAINRQKLTTTAVDKLMPARDSYRVFDSEIIGLYVTVYPAGTRSYGVSYRDKHNRLRRHTIGKHGAITNTEARAAAKKLVARIHANNFDPAAKQQADRAELTVNGLLDLYLASSRFAEKAASTQQIDAPRLANHIRPLIGKKRLTEITPDTIRKVKADIENGKTANGQVRGGAGAARMALRVLRAVFSWAVDEGIASSNPCQRIKLGSDGVRKTILKNADEYRRLFEALARLTATRQMTQNAADCIRIIALTGARRDEVAACRWRNIDSERGLIVLDAKQHKAGHHTGEAKEIPLPAAARAIIAKRERGEPEEYVFTGRDGVGHTWLNSKLWVKIRREADLPEGISSHALRHSLGTMLALQGAEAAQIMGALGHSQLSTTERYINLATDMRAQFLEEQTAGIAAALNGSKDKAELHSLKERKA